MNGKSILHLLLFILFSSQLSAQSAKDYTIQANVTVQESPSTITIHWQNIGGSTVSVYRKTKESSSWNLLTSTTDTFYTDNTVALDVAYEYKLRVSSPIAKSAYLYASVKLSPQHQRGALMLLIDDYYLDSCSVALKELEMDILKDGWDVVTHHLSRSLKDTSIKHIILEEYANNPKLKAVFIVGHLAVPYSGDIAPDAHTNHQGAWPADVYYADVNENWIDVVTNNSSASRTQNKNIPGDGKWDLSSITKAELQISRIDFYDMPAFGHSEIQMMNNYLNKAHQFKMNQLSVSNKAVIDDNFGGFNGEAFAANAWRNFPQLINAENIFEADYLSTLKDSAYIWSYGCGAGSYNSCNGVGNTNGIAAQPNKGIFTMLFGSYFGDWDNTNNLLRAPLCASEPALTSCWAGRPNWFFHFMGLGENIGYCTQITQNNSSLYTPANYAAKNIHIALMGDLTLRMKYIEPASNLTITPLDSNGAQMSWSPSPDADVVGYYVYKSDKLMSGYEVISDLITTTTFTDTIGTDGKYYFMIKPVKLELTPSGKYYNLGLGIIDSAEVNYPVGIEAYERFNNVAIYPNPTSNTLNIQAQYTGNLDKVMLYIIDISGKTIKQYECNAKNSAIDEQINVSSLAQGNYLLKITNPKNGFSKAYKFSKQK